MRPITVNLHNRQTGPNKADRRFSMNFTVLLAAKDIDSAKKECLKYLKKIKTVLTEKNFHWDGVTDIIKNGRFVHNLRKK